MPKKGSTGMARIGVWSYVAGIVIALLVSLTELAAWSTALLVILGVIVGLLNIADEEVQLFLLASVAFVVAAMALSGPFSMVGAAWLSRLMNAIVLFTAPGALVVSFQALYRVAKSG